MGCVAPINSLAPMHYIGEQHKSPGNAITRAHMSSLIFVCVQHIIKSSSMLVHDVGLAEMVDGWCSVPYAPSSSYHTIILIFI